MLRQLVATLKAVVRQNDSVGRYGGEEFLILMPDTGPQAALEVAERARGMVESRGLEAASGRIPLTVSAGVAAYPADGTDWDTLAASADTALYAAKAGGRNRVCAAEPPTAASASPMAA